MGRVGLEHDIGLEQDTRWTMQGMGWPDGRYSGTDFTTQREPSFTTLLHRHHRISAPPYGAYPFSTFDIDHLTLTASPFLSVHRFTVRAFGIFN